MRSLVRLQVGPPLPAYGGRRNAGSEVQTRGGEIEVVEDFLFVGRSAVVQSSLCPPRGGWSIARRGAGHTRALETGIVYVHNGTIGAEVHLPFGGVKSTGNGHREAGIAGIDFFTEWETVYIDYSGALQRAQIDRRP